MSVSLPPAAFPRFQLVELTDLAGCPLFLRRYLLEYLATIIRLAKAFDPVAKVLAALVDSQSSRQVVDLCAGGGGPWPSLSTAVAKESKTFERVVLTDRHPLGDTFRGIAERSEGRVVGHDEPVDALSLPGSLGGVRTMFDGLHHFPPEAARELLASAYRARVPILVAEGVERSARGLVAVLLSPIFVWLVTPFVRPFSVMRLVLTYLLPVVPLAVLFDGVVSCLRAYRPAELLALVKGLDDGYAWEAMRLSSGPAAITLLVGRPTAP